MDRSCCELNLEIKSSLDAYKKFAMELDFQDNNLIACLVATLVVLATTVIWLISRSLQTKRTAVLLVGISDSGKTNLFSQLVAGESRETLTSLKENEAPYKADGKSNVPLSIVDIPGHEAIRQQVLERFKTKARGVVFVVDSETFQKNLKDVAEYLYQIFTDSTLNKLHPSVCIVCNKQDLLMAKSKRVIQAQLEKELNTVRKTQSAALTSLSGGADKVFLGNRGEDFHFQQMSKFKVNFEECSAKPNGDGSNVNLDGLKSWIASLS